MTIKIHPAAECVRLMDPEELASLAASIEAHGLRDPIIMGRVNGAASEMLVDGRNRLRACEIAGVEPRFESKQFEDDEAIKAFVDDKLEHRNISKGQKAMKKAWLYPEPEKGGRGKKGKATETGGFSPQRLSAARAVLAYSRELALAVRDGTKKLDDALAEVKAARDAVNSDEWMLARLRNEAPDLAELVAEERMKPREAIAALEERIADLDRKRRTATQLLATFVYTWHPRAAAPAEFAGRMTENVTPKYWPDDGAIPLTARNIEQAAKTFAAIAAIAAKWEDKA